jgi:hypothetical protein
MLFTGQVPRVHDTQYIHVNHTHAGADESLSHHHDNHHIDPQRLCTHTTCADPPRMYADFILIHHLRLIFHFAFPAPREIAYPGVQYIIARDV